MNADPSIEPTQAVTYVLRKIPAGAAANDLVLRAQSFCHGLINDLLQSKLPRAQYLFRLDLAFPEALFVARAACSGTGRAEWVWAGLARMHDIHRAVIENRGDGVIADIRDEFIQMVRRHGGGIDLATSLRSEGENDHDSSVLYNAVIITCALFYREVTTGDRGHWRAPPKRLRLKMGSRAP